MSPVRCTPGWPRPSGCAARARNSAGASGGYSTSVTRVCWPSRPAGAMTRWSPCTTCPPSPRRSACRMTRTRRPRSKGCGRCSVTPTRRTSPARTSSSAGTVSGGCAGPVDRSPPASPIQPMPTHLRGHGGTGHRELPCGYSRGGLMDLTTSYLASACVTGSWLSPRRSATRPTAGRLMRSRPGSSNSRRESSAPRSRSAEECTRAQAAPHRRSASCRPVGTVQC